MGITITSSGTPTPFPPISGAGHQNQLATGHYDDFVPWTSTAYVSQTATDTEPFVVYPRPDSETDANARHRWAHDQMIYEIPIILRGGAFDYWVEVDTSNTSAALLPYITVTNNWRNRTGARSCYVQITAAGVQTLAKDGTAYTVQLRAYDQTGKELKIWWSFKPEAVEGDHFIFSDNIYAGGGNNGNWSTPYTGLTDTISGTTNIFSGTGVNSNEMILCIKEGNSQTPASEYTKDNNWLSSTTAFWVAIINNPADTNRPVIDCENVNVIVGLPGASWQDDLFVYGIEAINGDNDPATEGYGAFNRFFGGAQLRVTLSWLKLDTVSAWAAGTPNCGVLTLGEGSREHVAITDIEMTNIADSNAASNNGVGLMLMGLKYFSIDNIYVTNFHDTATTVPALAILKHRFSEGHLRRLTCFENSRHRRVIINDQTTHTGYEGVNIEFCYNNLERTDASNTLIGFIQAGASAILLGPAYCYRNTMGGTSGQQTTNWDVVHTFKGNVSTVASNFSGSTGVIETQPNYHNLVSGDFNADNTLVNAWYTTNSETRGTVGHEIV